MSLDLEVLFFSLGYFDLERDLSVFFFDYLSIFEY